MMCVSTIIWRVFKVSNILETIEMGGEIWMSIDWVRNYQHQIGLYNQKQAINKTSSPTLNPSTPETTTLGAVHSESNEVISLNLSRLDADVRCIVLLVVSQPGTFLSELAQVTCNLYQHLEVGEESDTTDMASLKESKEKLKTIISFKPQLNNAKDLCGSVFAMFQMRGGDAEAIAHVNLQHGKDSKMNKYLDDDEGSEPASSSSYSQSPSLGQQLKEQEEQVHSNEPEQTNYYWEVVSKQVDIGHGERFLDAFMYAMSKRVLPNNLFHSMKNRLTYIVHLRQEEKKAMMNDKMAIASMLKDDDHDEDEDYIVRVYSELTGSVLIDQLIVEEAVNYLKNVLETTAEKSPFIPMTSEESKLLELEKLKKKEEEQSEKKDTQPKYSIQKSYIFNEDRVKIYIGWQSLSGRSYSRYYLTATVLFFGKYGARLGHIDQYTNYLTLARIENNDATTETGLSGSSTVLSSHNVSHSSALSVVSSKPVSSSSNALTKNGTKTVPAAVFLKEYKDVSGKENDLCAEIDLTRLPRSIQTIMVVVTATSNAQDSGFHELKDPFVKITTPAAGDIYRYQINAPDRAHQSFIACKMTCLRSPNEGSSINLGSSMKNSMGGFSAGSFRGLSRWRISNIGEYSMGVHPLIDPHLKAQIQPHIETVTPPPCLQLATQAELEEEEREKQAELLLAQQEGQASEEKKDEEEVTRVSDAADLDLKIEAKDEKSTDEKKASDRPHCFRISKQEVRTVGFDFSAVKNLHSLHVLEFSQYGKLLTGAKPIMINEANDMRKRKLAKKSVPLNIPANSGSFVINEPEESEQENAGLQRQDQMFQSLTSFHRVDLNYSKERHAPYFLCFLLKFKDFTAKEDGAADSDDEDVEDSLMPGYKTNHFRLWNVDEKLDMCSAHLGNVFNLYGRPDALEIFNCRQHANLSVIAYRGGQRDEWFIEILDEIVAFKSPARRYLRSILQKCQFDISEPSCDIFKVPSQKDTVLKKEFQKDHRDLVLGLGVVGNGGSKHIINAEVELYDHFARYIGKVYDGYSDMDAKLKHRPINFLTVYTQDDEEQFDIRVRDLMESSPVKYIVANVEVKSRSVLTENSVVYCRVVDMRTGEELVRVQTPGSTFLDKYSPKKDTKPVVEEDEDDDSYDSADESDNDIVSTMCVIELSKEGWKITGCGENNLVDMVPKYIAPRPEGLKMEISRGRNLIPVDHGSADPYLRIKLNEKNSRKGAKKQKVRTKILTRTIHPDWNETHSIHIFDYEDYLIVKCMDYEKTRDQYMGEFRVKVGDLLRLHNSGRERRFILRSDEYWKAKEGKLVGSKKEAAYSSPSMGEIYIKFSPCDAKEVTIKK